MNHANLTKKLKQYLEWEVTYTTTQWQRWMHWAYLECEYDLRAAVALAHSVVEQLKLIELADMTIEPYSTYTATIE